MKQTYLYLLYPLFQDQWWKDIISIAEREIKWSG